MKPILIAAVAAIALSAPAQANIFSDAVDAVAGHVADVTDRLTHNDMFISGIELSSNMFRDDDIGRDPAHWTDGTATLVEGGTDLYVQFGEDFKNGLAPDLYVYVATSKVVDEKSFWAAKPVEVAKLESGSGAQFYKLPEMMMMMDEMEMDMDTMEMDSMEEMEMDTMEMEGQEHVEIIIWCKRFGAFMGAVSLSR